MSRRKRDHQLEAVIAQRDDALWQLARYRKALTDGQPFLELLHEENEALRRSLTTEKRTLYSSVLRIVNKVEKSSDGQSGSEACGEIRKQVMKMLDRLPVSEQ